ncbi:hypothetical protein O181_079935 [Austropuccinia psidii MF-1]|uniref:Uncharacterized protein n=1 Tax=Austropuccinia psidii MF-1 TaxID=1389203 RepID=A0A9Q3IIE9_9BASI|nr:hypothetical protein [Austropuccinia psidii MF-1]
MLEAPSPLVVGQFILVQRSPFQISKAEVCDELDGEEVEVVPNSISHQSSTLPYQHASKRFKSQVRPITPRSFQPVLSTIPSSIPPPSPNPLTSRSALVSPVRPSPIPHPRNSPMVTSNSYNLWPAPKEEEKIDHLHYFLFPAYLRKGNVGLSGLPGKIQIWQTMTRMLRRVDRNRREVITYAIDRMIPGMSFEEKAAKSSWYED